jgi:hypothetical protein
MKPQDIFLGALVKPYFRRMDYLYTGISDSNTIYFLGTDNPGKYGIPKNKEHFKFCYPGQSVGVVSVDDLEIQKTIFSYLGVYGEKLKYPGYVDILKFSSYMTKIKWNLDKVVFEEIISFWFPLDSQFVVMQLVELFSKYSSITNTCSGIYTDIADDVCIDDLTFRHTVDGGTVCARLVKGYDKLFVSPNVGASFSGIRLWGRDNVYEFGYVIKCDGYTVLGARTHVLCVMMKNKTFTNELEGET